MESGGISRFSHVNGDWSLFRLRLEQFLLIRDDTKTIKLDASQKRAYLLNLLEAETLTLLINLCFPSKVTDVAFDQLIELIEKHCSRPRSVFKEREKFYQAKQSLGESVRDFAVRLRGLSSFCEFGTRLPECLADAFAIGMLPGRAKEKIFLEGTKLTFNKMEELAITVSALDNLVPEIKSEVSVGTSGGVNSIKRSYSPGRDSHPDKTQGFRRSSSRSKSPEPKGFSNIKKCTICGESHLEKYCKFKNAKCFNCHKVGHLKKFCKNHNVYPIFEQSRDKVINRISYINPFRANIIINKLKCSAMIDSGASMSVMPDFIFNRYFRDVTLSPDKRTLSGYDGKPLNLVGSACFTVEYNNIKNNLLFTVVINGSELIVGRDFMEAFNLKIVPVMDNSVSTIKDKIEMIYNEFPEVFSPGLGKFSKHKVSFKVNKEARPVFFNARPVPFAIKEKIERELETMVADGIISPVTSSEYASPIVPVIKKNGNVRICVDYKRSLNLMTDLERYPLPSINEVVHKVSSGKVFAKLDLRQAYSQLELADFCKKYTTINTHLGLFQYNRLVFGFKSAPAIFARTIASCLQGLKGVAFYLDDIIISGVNELDLVYNIQAVCARLRECGLRVNTDKCDFFVESVEFLGYVISGSGIQPQPNKLEAIKNAPYPTDVHKLKSLLGFLNFYRNFIPRMSSILEPLHNLLKKGVEWNFSEDCKVAVDTIKELMGNNTILTNYFPDLPVKLYTDASTCGLGAALMHVFKDGTMRPIEFASRSLTTAEKKYSILDLEALAIVFGLNKFFQYLFGREFTLCVDNMPLLRILGEHKNIPVLAANRLQRYGIILAGFSYKTEFVKSCNNQADFLSRLPLKDTVEDFKDDCGTDFVCFIENCDHVNFQAVVLATAADSELQLVFRYLRQGWPKRVNRDSIIWKYWLKRNELSIVEDCLFWQHRIVIPVSLQRQVLDLLHRSHLGIVKMRGISKTYFWWTSLNKDLEEVVQSCSDCSLSKQSPPKSQLTVWPNPGKAWSRVHLDYCGPLAGKMFLVVCDSFSKWLDCIEVQKADSTHTIMELRKIFSNFGNPELIVSDNGSVFTSEEFKVFLKENNIKLMTSPVKHPQSNGLAENAVKISKMFLKKLLINGKFPLDYNVKLLNFLMDYRNSFHCSTGIEPAVLLVGRRLRSTFDSLLPVKNGEDFSEKVKEANVNISKAQSDQARLYRGVKTRVFKVGQKCWTKDYRHDNKVVWAKGVVSRKLGKKVYIIKIGNTDVTWKRHVDQMREMSVSWKEDSKIAQHPASEILRNEPHELETATLLRGLTGCSPDFRLVGEEVVSEQARQQRPWSGRLRSSHKAPTTSRGDGTT